MIFQSGYQSGDSFFRWESLPCQDRIRSLSKKPVSTLMVYEICCPWTPSSLLTIWHTSAELTPTESSVRSSTDIPSLRFMVYSSNVFCKRPSLKSWSSVKLQPSKALTARLHLGFRACMLMRYSAKIGQYWSALTEAYRIRWMALGDAVLLKRSRKWWAFGLKR